MLPSGGKLLWESICVLSPAGLIAKKTIGWKVNSIAAFGASAPGYLLSTVTANTTGKMKINKMMFIMQRFCMHNVHLRLG